MDNKALFLAEPSHRYKYALEIYSDIPRAWDRLTTGKQFKRLSQAKRAARQYATALGKPIRVVEIQAAKSTSNATTPAHCT